MTHPSIMLASQKFASALLLWLVCSTQLWAEARPNFVFVIADDCTYRDLGCYGGQAYTPNMDRLATEGMRFTRCFQTAPMCSPTRHNIYTGLYPVRSGAYPNHTFAKAGTKSIVHHLKPLGYRVALSGKRHIGPQTVFPFEYSEEDNNPDMTAIDRLFDECKEQSTPFCLFACSNEPHSPWNKGDRGRYPADKVTLPFALADTPVTRDNFSRYLAEITYYDQQVGEILDLLAKHELDESTVVMVVSEQGSSFPFAKWTCYSDGLQSAMIVRWPGQVQPESVTDAMVEYVDITPTFIDIAGGQIDDLDGQSFFGVLNGKTRQHKSFSFGAMTTRGIINGSDAFAIRTVRGPRYRLIWNLHHETKFTNACTSSDYFRSIVAAAKQGDAEAAAIVQRYQFRPEFELYDCQSDPQERVNLAGKPELASTQAQLMTQLNQWMQNQGDMGVETELDALSRQGRYRNMSREEAVAAWRNKNRPKNGAKKPKRNKTRKDEPQFGELEGGINS